LNISPKKICPIFLEALHFFEEQGVNDDCIAKKSLRPIEALSTYYSPDA
jgi:hypothetical protein